MPSNAALAERFHRITRLIELLGGDRFRAIAHDRAARAIEAHPSDLAALADGPDARAALQRIDGIGPKIADKIIEFCSTGAIAELAELEARVPAGLAPLMDIPGLGPKTLAVLWHEGGVTDLTSLKALVDSPKIFDLPRMGAKSVAKLKESIALAEQGQQRLALGLARPLAEAIVARMKAVPGVADAAFAGSLRRGRDTIGDLDILVCVKDEPAGEQVGAAFRSMPGVQSVLVSGHTKSSVRIALAAADGRFADESEASAPPASAPGVQADLRVVPAESWGAALHYFTGSKEHNIQMRELALKKGLTLNEYGLFPDDDDPVPPQSRGVKAVAGRSEAEIFRALGLPEIPPELREARGETKLKSDPPLIETADIMAELHAHTTASDGEMSIDALAAEAARRGFHTIAVTDHSKSSVIAGGLSPERLVEHAAAVREADRRSRSIRILAGSEVDILADGRLDYSDDLLNDLDAVVASPHTALSQDPTIATRRLIRAIENPHVNILGHPTGRLINRRGGLLPDLSSIIAAAVAHRVALEINSHWLRLDLRDTHVRAAVEAGCLIAINCDVHEAADFDHLQFGITTARRGWLPPELCVNTWPAKRLHAWLAEKHRPRR